MPDPSARSGPATAAIAVAPDPGKRCRLRQLLPAAYSLYCFTLSVNVRIGMSISCAARVLTPPAASSASTIRRRSSSSSSSAIGRNARLTSRRALGAPAVPAGASRLPPSSLGQVAWLDGVVGRRDRRVLHRVAQLAHVARPVVCEQHLHRRRRDRIARAGRPRARGVEERAREQRDLAAAVAQRRQHHASRRRAGRAGPGGTARPRPRRRGSVGRGDQRGRRSAARASRRRA